MTSYETLFIVNPNATEEELDNEIAKVHDIISAAGEVKATDKMGKKKLAYEINKMSEGYFTLVTFDAEPSVLENLNHIYRITENILRGIYVKLEK